MVEWSIEAFRTCERVGSIVVSCPPGHLHEPAEPRLGAGPGSGPGREPSPAEGGETRVVEGGRTRSESVANALEAVETELVAIHDAARPLVTPELIEGVIAALLADSDADGAIAATPVTDTIKQVAGSGAAGRVGSREDLMPFDVNRVINASDSVETTLDRRRLWAAQTPQVFHTQALREALGADPQRVAAATDEAMLVEAAGGRVLIHPSPPENLKVTTPLDLRLAELLLQGRSR